MIEFRAHFDGERIVPDEPVDLPVDQPLSLQIEIALQVPETEGMRPVTGGPQGSQSAGREQGEPETPRKPD